jgi:hypothetical protein
VIIATRRPEGGADTITIGGDSLIVERYAAGGVARALGLLGLAADLEFSDLALPGLEHPLILGSDGWLLAHAPEGESRME